MIETTPLMVAGFVLGALVALILGEYFTRDCIGGNNPWLR